MGAPANKKSILVVDDAPDTLEILKRNLTSKGYRVFTSSGVEEALNILENTPIDLVVTDIKMPKVSGLDLVRYVRENLRATEVMVITGYASINGAIEAVKTGAEEYLPKPFTDEELFSSVERALEKLNLRKADLPDIKQPDSAPYSLIGKSDAMQKVYDIIARAAAAPVTALITGESGTGKELIARAIHYSSKRASAPFVPVNCGGIPEGLLESELFGYVKGAFTGASESRAGFFQTADKGTIFLDEVSNTSLSMQAKLLRVLQDKEVRMIGSNKSVKIDARILAATNKNLSGLVEREHFRDDLFFRLNVLTINLPPLRDRGDDVLLLARYFLGKYAKEFGKGVSVFTDKARSALRSYSWPGNIRELENLVQRMVVMVDGEKIEVTDLPPYMRFSVQYKKGLNRSLQEVEIEHINNVLASVGGNKTQAAEILGIDRKTLREKLKKIDNHSR
ncbi:MAG TPA: sigma-54 dependent transcriptional regulator [Myxococcota bacterium]|nr:sigma-54 dependent transcriptional regulator [Myxococcota bacterium]